MRLHSSGAQWLVSSTVKEDRGIEVGGSIQSQVKWPSPSTGGARSGVTAHTGPTESGISTYPQPHLGKSRFNSGQFSD